MASLWDDLDSLVNSPSSFTAATAERGTIKPQTNFDAGDDAVALRKAIEGLGTEEKTLIDILTHRSSAQRQLICEAYQEATGRALVDDLKGDTSGDFGELLVALVTPPAAFDCHEVMRAMKGAGTEDSTLIEIFASRSNQQIKALTDVYLEETEKKLTLDLKSEVSGDFANALLILAEGKREENTTVDADKAKEDAKTLYDAGEKKWGTDESKFVDILCQRSIPQLRQTLVEYKNISGKTLQASIEGEMSGELEELLVAIVKCVKSVPAYFAERLYGCMKGGGTDERTLNRIMVSRSEIDLLDIRAEFKKLYEYSLHSAIESDCGGKYGKTLLKICGGDDD
ncbi:annexin A3a isoform X1 [Epinephelus lanceolatus]|uniref:annexin A3a isoform X1 n=1 Tax=Epinephelus lanceolatus TaxID=310571 RepID=UPI00144757F4|nr:annexin A3a isoform X1 [Epinephelus lanceolatus]XP_033474928.1 annexin A3a isoform X1 [Epinephelus lanceolatus]